MGPPWRRGQRRGTSGTRARPLFQPKPEISRLALSRARIHQVKFQLLWSLGPNQGVEYADHKMRLAAASGHAVMSETNVDVIMEVQGGKVIAIGPGQPLPPPSEEQEPWKDGYRAPRFLPMQAELGDYALFFRKAAIEITFEDERYLVVPHGAILVVVRGKDGDIPNELPEDLG